MATGWQQLWDRIKGTPAERRACVAIARDHCDDGAALGRRFAPDAHYFAVRLNEMYLAREREWATRYDPLVTVVSEFIYGSEEVKLPTAVGPSLLQQDGGAATPAGRMSLRNTRVAGLHPFRGGRLALTVILFKVERTNHARDLLDLVGLGAKALDFSSALAPYLKIAGTLLGGVESMLKLNGTQAVLGQRIERDTDAAAGIEPGYHALIDLPADDVKSERLWVKEGQLHEGASMERATPFERGDFVLYSVVRDDRRSDLALLPATSGWTRVKREAQTSVPDAWTNAKVNLAGLIQTARESADLTPAQAEELVAGWKTEAVRLHEDAVNFARLGPDDDKAQRRRAAAVRDEALAVLAL